MQTGKILGISGPTVRTDLKGLKLYERVFVGHSLLTGEVVRLERDHAVIQVYEETRGLAVGEPPTTKGYPPSVFAHLPRLLERAGNGARGGITGIYTVLVDGDDFNEPVADASRSILDGHIVLTRRLASAGHFPAIDVLESKSRVRDQIIDEPQRTAAGTLMRLEAAYREKEDLILVGAYQKGSDPMVDMALRSRDKALAFLQQRPDEVTPFRESRQALLNLFPRPAGGGMPA